MTTRRAIVTGGTGFIGRLVVDRLLGEGVEVILVGRGTGADATRPGVTFEKCDLLDCSDLTSAFRSWRADTLVHLAWEARPPGFWNSAANLDWVAASVRLIQAFAAASGERIVAAGTCAEYDAPGSGPCVATVTPTRPSTLYGVAKDAFHRLLGSYSRSVGLSYAWGRIFFLTGSEDHASRLIPAAMSSLISGNPFSTGSGTAVRDYIDVRDCASAFARLALSNFAGPINISSGQPITIASLMDLIGRITKRPDLIRIGSTGHRGSDVPNLWGDATSLRDILGFAPKWTLEQSLMEEYLRLRSISASPADRS